MLRTFEARFVGQASAADLGHIRAVTCLAALAVHIPNWHVVTSAALPRELFRRLGIMQIVGRIPGFQALLSSQGALTVLWGAGLLALLMALVGYRTRVTVPIAAVVMLVFGGILRGYAFFFHTGLLPTLLLVMLALLPCGDGFSLDARRRRRADPDQGAPVPSLTYGWSRWTCWLIVASAYFVASFSKMRYGGLGWWRAGTMHSITATAAVREGHFKSDLASSMMNAPDMVFTAMGIFGLGIELAAVLLLLSARARRWVPIGLVALHVSVWIVQRIVFLDAIILQGIFLLSAWRRPAAEDVVAVPPRSARRPRLIVGAAAAFAAIQLVVWLVGLEWYPLTGWRMYSTRRSGRVSYSRMYARYASGHREPVGAGVPRLLNAAMSVRAGKCSQKERPASPACRAMFDAVLDAIRARSAGHDDPVVAIERETYRWNFRKQPDDPQRGELKRHFIWPPGAGVATSPTAVPLRSQPESFPEGDDAGDVEAIP